MPRRVNRSHWREAREISKVIECMNEHGETGMYPDTLRDLRGGIFRNAGGSLRKS